MQPSCLFTLHPAHISVHISVQSVSHLCSDPFFSAASISPSSLLYFPSHPFFPVTKLAVSLSICWFFLQRPCTCSHLLSCWPPLLSSPLSLPLYLSLSLSPSRSLSLSAQCNAARPVPGSVSLSVIQSICRQVNFVYSGWPKPLFFFKEH